MKRSTMIAAGVLCSLAPAIVNAEVARSAIGSTAHPDRLPVSDVMSWVVANDRTVYVEDTAGRWYRVDLGAPCPPLAGAVDIAFASRSGEGFTNASALVTGGGRCAIGGIVPVAAPALPQNRRNRALGSTIGR
jgi:hypothetical protein